MRETALSIVCILVCAALRPACGQNSVAALHGFEAASIRPVERAGDGKLPRIRVDPKIFVASGATLKALITDAYQINQYQISGTPSWIASDAYDIRAVSESAASREEMRSMLRVLLEDRFALKYHRETRELPVYALVIGKNGPKFRELRDGEEFPSYGAVGHMRSTDLSRLAAFLSLYSSNRPIVNKTGLTGRYQLDVDITPYIHPGEPRGDSDPYAVVLQETLRQLGLDLVSMKAPIEMFVVDHVEKPSPN